MKLNSSVAQMCRWMNLSMSKPVKEELMKLEVQRENQIEQLAGWRPGRKSLISGRLF